MKNLQFNPYQCGARHGEFKKSKPIPAPSCSVGLKFPNSRSITFARWEKPVRDETGGDRAKLLSILMGKTGNK